jgi:hypothetical protein
MFKWACLAAGSVFLAALLWMVNDIRLQLGRSAGVVTEAGVTINENLPQVVERTRRTAEVVADHLPGVLDRAQVSAEVLAELAEDIRQLKELAGAGKERDRNLISYTDSLLRAIEQTGGKVGVSKTLSLSRSSIKDARPVSEWVADARKEALFWMLLVSTKKDMAQKLARTKLGFPWMIEVPGSKPEPLLDWLKEHHPETKGLAW